MKNIINILLLLLIIFYSCSDNPVKEEQKIDMTNYWETVFSSGEPHLITGDSMGKYWVLAYGNFANCSFIKIRINYIANYKNSFDPPYISCPSYGLLRQSLYSTWDTTIRMLPSTDSILPISFYVHNGKLYIDTVEVLKGHKNY